MLDKHQIKQRQETEKRILKCIQDQERDYWQAKEEKKNPTAKIWLNLRELQRLSKIHMQTLRNTLTRMVSEGTIIEGAGPNRARLFHSKLFKTRSFLEYTKEEQARVALASWLEKILPAKYQNPDKQSYPEHITDDQIREWGPIMFDIVNRRKKLIKQI